MCCRCSPQDSSNLPSPVQQEEDEEECPGDCLHTSYSLSVARSDLTDTVKLHLRDKVEGREGSPLLTRPCQGSHGSEYQGHRVEADHGHHRLHDNHQQATASHPVHRGDRRSLGVLPRVLRHHSDGVLPLRGQQVEQGVPGEGEDEESRRCGVVKPGTRGGLQLRPNILNRLSSISNE